MEAILGKYIEAGLRDTTNTIQQLLCTFDEKSVIRALTKLRQTIHQADWNKPRCPRMTRLDSSVKA